MRAVGFVPSHKGDRAKQMTRARAAAPCRGRRGNVPAGSLDYSSSSEAVLLRYSESPAASRACFQPFCSTNHSWRAILPREESSITVPPDVSSVFTPLPRP